VPFEMSGTNTLGRRDRTHVRHPYGWPRSRRPSDATHSATRTTHRRLHNAGRQARLEAEAKRKLEAVACTPLLRLSKKGFAQEVFCSL
jgi:hypothetical protein